MHKIHINTGFSPNDIDILKTFKGKKLVKMRHSEPIVTTTVMCVVEFVFEDSTYCLTNEQYPIRYYQAEIEDIACLHMHEGENPYDVINIHNHDVGAVIEKVSIVTDTVHATMKDGSESYTNSITDGVIFTFSDGRELGFERFCEFIEGIEIYEGCNVLEMFFNPEYWIEGMEEDFSIYSVERSTATLK